MSGIRNARVKQASPRNRHKRLIKFGRRGPSSFLDIAAPGGRWRVLAVCMSHFWPSCITKFKFQHPQTTPWSSKSISQKSVSIRWPQAWSKKKNHSPSVTVAKTKNVVTLYRCAGWVDSSHPGLNAYVLSNGFAMDSSFAFQFFVHCYVKEISMLAFESLIKLPHTRPKTAFWTLISAQCHSGLDM